MTDSLVCIYSIRSGRQASDPKQSARGIYPSGGRVLDNRGKALHDGCEAIRAQGSRFSPSFLVSLCLSLPSPPSLSLSDTLSLSPSLFLSLVGVKVYPPGGRVLDNLGQARDNASEAIRAQGTKLSPSVPLSRCHSLSLTHTHSHPPTLTHSHSLAHSWV